MVEQFVAQAFAISDRAYVIANGKVAREGTAKAVASDPEVIESFLGKKKTH